MNFMFPADTQTVDAKGRYAALSPDKLRGGYYTPTPVAEWLCAWAIRDKADAVLEPSCGAGAIATAAAARLRALKATAASAAKQLTAVELVAVEAEKTRDALAVSLGRGAAKAVSETDFFAWWDERGETRFDAVVGNPPFIRYQSFPEPARGRAMAMMERLGLKPNRLTNIWVPAFVAIASGRYSSASSRTSVRASRSVMARSAARRSSRSARSARMASSEIWTPASSCSERLASRMAI
jgi:hypothetical protein